MKSCFLGTTKPSNNRYISAISMSNSSPLLILVKGIISTIVLYNSSDGSQFPTMR